MRASQKPRTIDPIDLAYRIRSSRESKGLSQSAVAGIFGIRRNAVTAWELGDTRPDKAKLPKLAEILGVSVAWLVSGSED